MSAETIPTFAPPRALAERLRASWHLGGLACVLGLAAFLDFFKLSQNGYANTYYAGAVRSMLKSWHNFLFASFDAGGLVSVDKPPLALWVEALSAKAFGYSGVAILLPEALAGVLSVWLLYLLVTRVFGRVGGLVAALALAVSPVSVSVNRDNNPDAIFVLLLVLAVYVGVRALDSGRLRTLLLSAALVGLAFNTKMLAAMVVVPGLGLALLYVKAPWRKRLAFLAAAGAVLVVVSGAWIAAVDLTPAADRPYVGSTTDNSALSLALGYNGLGRVTGQTGGTSFGGGMGGAFSGTAGFFRLLNDALGDQGGWLLAFAIVGGISALLAAVLARRRRELGALVVLAGWFVAAAAVFSLSSGIIHTYYLSALAPATSALVGIGAVTLWRDARATRWRLALPLLALASSAWLEVTLLRRSDYLPWLQTLVIVAVIAAALALVLAALPSVVPARARAAVAAAGLAAGIAALLAAPTAWSATVFKQSVSGIFPGAGPNFISGLGTSSGGFGFGGGGFQGPGVGRFGAGGPGPAGNVGRPSRFTPGAGGTLRTVPGLAPGGGALRGAQGGGRGADSADVSGALAYAKAHAPGSRWALIVSSETTAAPYVIKGESVAAMGGFTGRETVLTHAYLAKLVRSGEARYFLVGGGGGFGGGSANNSAVQTVASICKPVPAASWSTTSTSSGGSSLYDCAGKADAIAAAG